MPRDGSMLAPPGELRAGAWLRTWCCRTTLATPARRGWSRCRSAPLTAYTQRWISQWQWLRLRGGPGVDGRRDGHRTAARPVGAPAGDALYCGWEPTVLGCGPGCTHTPPNLLAWVDENRDRMLLNTGVVGGDRRTVMNVPGMIDAWALSPRGNALQEMCFYNYVVYSPPMPGIK